MSKSLISLLVVCVALFLAVGCSKNSTGPTSGTPSTVTLSETAGALDAHPAGANTPVKDSATATTVGSKIQSQAMSAMGKAMQSGTAKIAAGSTDGTISKTITGTNSGTATAAGSFSYNQSTGAVSYDIVCTFSNYSDDGLLYIGGQIHFVVNMVMTQTDTSTTSSGTYTITGKIRFNGSFVGTNSFTYTITMPSTGKKTYTYSSTIISDGTTTTINLSGQA
jgi:hypothetical protein